MFHEPISHHTYEKELKRMLLSRQKKQNLNNSKWVQKKVLQGGIISYNFTKDAFYKQHWDEITCKARGLFVDQQSEQVVARGYDKFFSW